MELHHAQVGRRSRLMISLCVPDALALAYFIFPPTCMHSTSWSTCIHVCPCWSAPGRPSPAARRRCLSRSRLGGTTPGGGAAEYAELAAALCRCFPCSQGAECLDGAQQQTMSGKVSLSHALPS